MANKLKYNFNDSNTASEIKQPVEKKLNTDRTSSDIEIYAKEVFDTLIKNNLEPTPNNFLIYFEKLLENKNDNFRKQIHSILEIEEYNNDNNFILLENKLKQGFSSQKTMLSIIADVYKNISLMIKILKKKEKKLNTIPETEGALQTINNLEKNVSKLKSILHTQTSQMKNIYDDTAEIIKSIKDETIFDNKFGVYNKRYLFATIEKEIGLMKEFGHKSSLIMIELSRELKKSVNNDKAILLMTRTIPRLLLKTSRRSDIVFHYGNGVFAILLKHTDIESAEKASEKLCDFISNSHFFFKDKEIQLKISIGVTDIDVKYSVEEVIINTIDAMQKTYGQKDKDFITAFPNAMKTKEILKKCS